jgi:hypothetical protein
MRRKRRGRREIKKKVWGYKEKARKEVIRLQFLDYSNNFK